MRTTPTPIHSENASAVLAAIMRTFGYTEQLIADHLGVSRQTVHAKKSGTTKLSVDDIGELCELFTVPAWIFYQSPAEAIRWIIDHPNRNLQMKYYASFEAVAA